MSLLGFVAGGVGEAGMKVGAKFGDYLEKSTLAEEAHAAQLVRDRTLEDMRRVSDSMGRQEGAKIAETAATTADVRATDREKRGYTHAEKIQAAGFEHAEDLLDARQIFDEEQNDLTRALTREQIASHEKTAALQRANALEVAKIGGTIHVDPEGNVSMIGKDGTSKNVMDPNNPTKTLMSAKDLTPAAKQYATVLGHRMAEVDKSLMTQEEKDKKTVVLREELIDVLTRGIHAAKAPTPMPPPTVGQVVAGKEFTGGDPRDQKNWKSPVKTSSVPAAPSPPAVESRINGGDMSMAAVARNAAEARRMRSEIEAKFKPVSVTVPTGGGGRPQGTRTENQPSKELREFDAETSYAGLKAAYDRIMTGE